MASPTRLARPARSGASLTLMCAMLFSLGCFVGDGAWMRYLQAHSPSASAPWLGQVAMLRVYHKHGPDGPPFFATTLQAGLHDALRLAVTVSLLGVGLYALLHRQRRP